MMIIFSCVVSQLRHFYRIIKVNVSQVHEKKGKAYSNENINGIQHGSREE